MIDTTLDQVAAVVGGTVHGGPRAGATVVSGAAYLDSRSPVADGLFVAVVGERSDGHAHADAGGHRAHAVLGTRPTSRPTVVVEDPVVALARLARHVAATLAPQVLAVTGSHGKTGTKDLLAQLLPGEGTAVVATEGNLNNELGVPLTVLRATAATRRLVLEMGARRVGHLAWLCDVARPDVALVLGVGLAHVGEFGSVDLIAAAKGELVEALAPGGTAVLNADDPRVAAMASRTAGRVTTFGDVAGPGAARGAGVPDVAWRGVVLDDAGRPGVEIGHEGVWRPVRLAGTGRHQVTSAAAAVAAAVAAGEPFDAVVDRLGRAWVRSRRRLEPRERADGLLVLDDTYNANPVAARAALQALAEVGRVRGGRTVAVLGPMGELGAASEQGHLDVGSWARAGGVDVVLAVGEAARPIAVGAGGAGLVVQGRCAALEWLATHVGAGDVVLVKASRPVGLDVLVDELLAAGPR